MARKSKTKSRRRSKQGVSLIGLAETVALGNVATQTLFNTNMYEFFFAQHRTTGAVGTYGAGNVITLRELFSPLQLTGTQTGRAGTQMVSVNQYDSTFNLITENLKSNWVSGVTGMILIPAGFKLGKKFARPAISRVNRALKQAGVASVVKV